MVAQQKDATGVDSDHYIVNCPKKNKGYSNKYDYSKRKDKHESSTHKYKFKKGFDPQNMMRRYFEKLEEKQLALAVSLSDVDSDGDSPPSDDDEFEEKIKNKFKELCFFADHHQGGFCTMALDKATIGADCFEQADGTNQL